MNREAGGGGGGGAIMRQLSDCWVYVVSEGWTKPAQPLDSSSFHVGQVAFVSKVCVLSARSWKLAGRMLQSLCASGNSDELSEV